MPPTNWGEVPNGLNDAKVAVLNSSDVAGASVDLSGVQSINFTIESDVNEVRGDDTLIASVRSSKSLSGGITVSRINITAYAAMIGGTTVPTGVDPNLILSLSESDAAVSQYFQLTAQANSYDIGGSAYRVLLKKLSITGGPSETLDQEAFDSPTLDFTGVAIGGVLIIRTQYQTKIAIP